MKKLTIATFLAASVLSAAPLYQVLITNNDLSQALAGVPSEYQDLVSSSFVSTLTTLRSQRLIWAFSFCEVNECQVLLGTPGIPTPTVVTPEVPEPSTLALTALMGSLGVLLMMCGRLRWMKN